MNIKIPIQKRNYIVFLLIAIICNVSVCQEDLSDCISEYVSKCPEDRCIYTGLGLEVSGEVEGMNIIDCLNYQYEFNLSHAPFYLNIFSLKNTVGTITHFKGTELYLSSSPGIQIDLDSPGILVRRQLVINDQYIGQDVNKILNIVSHDHIGILKVSNASLHGTISETFMHDIKNVAYLDLSNNNITGCARRMQTFTHYIQYCDMRKNNFDSGCDHSYIPCLLDFTKKSDCDPSKEDCICDRGELCYINPDNDWEEELVFNKTIKVKGDLTLNQSIRIYDYKKTLMETEDEGRVIISKDVNVTIFVDDELVDNVMKNIRREEVIIVNGKNDGELPKINVLGKNGKCIPISPIIHRDHTRQLGVYFISNPSKCSYNRTMSLVVALSVILGIFVIVLMVIIMALCYQPCEMRVFPFRRRLNQDDGIHVNGENIV